MSRDGRFAHRRQQKTAAVSIGGLFAHRKAWKKTAVSRDSRVAYRGCEGGHSRQSKNKKEGDSSKSHLQLFYKTFFDYFEAFSAFASFRRLRSYMIGVPMKIEA